MCDNESVKYSSIWIRKKVYYYEKYYENVVTLCFATYAIITKAKSPTVASTRVKYLINHQRTFTTRRLYDFKVFFTQTKT